MRAEGMADKDDKTLATMDDGNLIFSKLIGGKFKVNSNK
jgi:hypothetical protein